MPENANNIPLDDEDILDLTEVAEPGKKFDGPPEPGMDFGADLDALLDSLGMGDDAPVPPAVQAAPPTQAAPIADQTPVDHTIDPDEELAMPEMSDIDSLLTELGAIPPTPEKPTASPASAPMPEFDSILAQAQAAEAAKAEEEAQAAASIPESVVDPFEAALMAEQKPAADPFEAAITPKAPQPVAITIQSTKGSVQTPDVPKATQAEDDIDLNELDALLDDILATAPEMSAPAASPAAEPIPVQKAADTPMPNTAPPVPETIPVPDQAIMPVSEGIAALADRVQRLKEAVEAMEVLDLAGLAHKVQRLEEAVEVLGSQEISEPLIDGLIDTKLDTKFEALFEPDSLVMNKIMDAIKGRFANGAFNEDLEKLAAAAAAKVIREEIAALMDEG